MLKKLYRLTSNLVLMLMLMLMLGLCLLPATPLQAYAPWKAESYSDAGSAPRSIGGSTWLAQTYTTMNYAHNVISVKLHLCRWGNPGTVTVSIRGTSFGQPWGADLASGTLDGNSLPAYGSGFVWQEVTLSPTLSPNTPYAIVVRAPGGDIANNYVAWSATYLGVSGLKIYESTDGVGGNTSWIQEYVDDGLGFEVWSSSQPPNQLPELSSPMLIPNPALTTSDIYYYVHYYDPDADPGDVPGVRTVMIDYVDHTMSLLSGTASDGNYVHGPVRLPYALIHRYSFHFEDARGGVACLPSGCSGFYVGPDVTIPLGEALENKVVNWTTGGDSSWIGQNDITNDGVDAGRGGNITHDQAVWLQAAVNGPGNMSFCWKASSEQGYDFLSFYIDSVLQDQISGDSEWQRMAYDLSPGAHTLKWEYMKDRDTSIDSDAGWVDQVLLPVTYGYMGIGTETPQRILHLVGNVALFERSVNSSGFIIKRTPALRYVFGVDDPAGFVIKTYPEGSGAVVRMTIAPDGSVTIPGALTKGGGTFRIDHPLDPAHKYLSHSFVESPDMLNVYNGSAVLDGESRAVIELPPYFEALNRDYSYQLESVGSYAPLYIKQEITGNIFIIAGGKPGMKVSWQVIGIRHDPYANSHPVIVEQEKPVGQKVIDRATQP